MIKCLDDIKKKGFIRNVFNEKVVPEKVPRDIVELIMEDLLDEFYKVIKKSHKAVKIPSDLTPFMINEFRRVIFNKNFGEISFLFSLFDFEYMRDYQSYINIFFGAYNVPSAIFVVDDIKKLQMSQELKKDKSILKIIITNKLICNTFDGKSVVILNGTKKGIREGIITYSDIVPYKENSIDTEDSKKNNRLLGEARRLEKRLRGIYKELYKTSSFRKSMIQDPFNHIEEKDRNNLLTSLQLFVISNPLCLDDSKESFDLAIEWLHTEGVYFRDQEITIHDISLAIHYYRKQKKLSK